MFKRILTMVLIISVLLTTIIQPTNAFFFQSRTLKVSTSQVLQRNSILSRLNFWRDRLRSQLNDTPIKKSNKENNTISTQNQVLDFSNLQNEPDVFSHVFTTIPSETANISSSSNRFSNLNLFRKN